MPYKLGKLPAQHKPSNLKFANYVCPWQLPPLPAQFGHERLVTDWGMLLNDQLGCCVISGGEHEHLLWNKEAGKTVTFDDKATVANYHAIGGYDPNNPDSDQGCDVQVAADYRRKTGL